MYDLDLPLKVFQLRVLHIKFLLILLDQELIGLEDAGVLKKFSLLQDALFFLFV
jgi:hypothetical protein